jgi:DNA-binding transcriptional LysR family regulator
VVGVKTELELRQLRVFVAVVELGGHTRAARSLGVSQSTVSETLSSLERALGTALFRKGARSATLTPSGEALLPRARSILALASQLVVDLAQVSTDVNATLVVAAVESLNAYVLPSRLAALRARWPKVRLEVVTGACAEIQESVAAGKSDLGLVLEGEPGGGPDGGEDESILTTARLAVVAAPGHPLVLEGATPDQLRRCELLMSDAGGPYHRLLRQYFDAAQVPLPRTQALGNVEGVKRGLLAGGTALGCLPAHAVEQELRDGTLAEVEVRPLLPGLVLRALIAPGAVDSPLVDDLVRSLRGVVLVT